MINLERGLLRPGVDDTFVMLIRRENLDAMAARTEATTHGHAAEVLRIVKNAGLIHKTPSIQVRGPMPIADSVDCRHGYRIGDAITIASGKRESAR